MKQTTVSSVVCTVYELGVLRLKIAEAVRLAGGWPEKICAAKTLLLKPNLLGARTPDEAVTTHPEFVRAVIHELRASFPELKIIVGDSPAVLRSWHDLWAKTGMVSLTDEPNVTLIPFEDVQRIQMANGTWLPAVKAFSETDAMITLPKLKTHLLTKVTGAVKNSYGLIVGEAKSSFHGEHPSPRKMSEFLGECYGILKPDFVIMDAILAMAGDGPSSGYAVQANLIFAGEDAVAVDAAASKMYGYTGNEIPLLVTAAQFGYGICNAEQIQTVGDGWDALAVQKPFPRSKSDFLHWIPQPLFNIISRFMRCTPVIQQLQCVKCGQCAAVCSQKAIYKNKKGEFRIRGGQCILCICCVEVCRYHAIELQSFWVRMFLGAKRKPEMNPSHERGTL